MSGDADNDGERAGQGVCALPAHTRLHSSLVASTVLLRYFIVITAGLLRACPGDGYGNAVPRHPWQLGLAFTFVAFAFLGLGLVVATIADNVPSVKALGSASSFPC